MKILIELTLNRIHFQWPADYEFIFQITDHPKAHLKIIHGGGIYFAKNSKINDWIAYCDFL
ncbi:hypothetical protein COJ13_26915 [Bacillus cereus]|nr:hypothetical protein COJ13_26915 [Bacillus cereus]